MQDVSKLVRSRLAKAQAAAGPHPGVHPDAGQLTAFAERSLRAREREHVLAHLAACADCREVVALAAPESAAAEQAAVAPRAAWLTVPSFSMKTMRWGAVGAAVAIVAVAVVLQSPRVSEMSRVTGSRGAESKNSAEAQRPAERTRSAAPTSTISAQPERTSPEQTTGNAFGVSAKESDAARERAALGGLRDDRTKDAGRKQSQSAAEDFDQKRRMEARVAENRPAAEPARAAAAPPPPATAPMKAQDELAAAGKAAPQPALTAATPKSEAETMEVAAKKDGLVAEEAKLAARRPAAPRPTASSVNGGRAADSGAAAGSVTASRAPASADTAYAPGFAGAELSRQNNEVLLKGKVVNYQWSVSSDGRVQRSSDGRTWVFVPVAEGVKFRALAAVGEKVWAGGSGTALYHSVDAGRSWKQVKLQALTGDIIHLMADRRSLIIGTSAGQRMEISYDSFGDGGSPAPIQH
jgi:hypothetical protein